MTQPLSDRDRALQKLLGKEVQFQQITPDIYQGRLIKQGDEYLLLDRGGREVASFYGREVVQIKDRLIIATIEAEEDFWEDDEYEAVEDYPRQPRYFPEASEFDDDEWWP
ncbi:MAG: hypothetical protein DPW09_29420 [Anaerolineae bacterium]|nr:hypothetical protein [Anaerolineales bacterium]MCQ3977569.1 hypothetical protein [Anaerolineae bacterium]